MKIKFFPYRTYIQKTTLHQKMTNTTHEIFEVSDGQFQIVYDVLSFTFAAIGASTVFFRLRLGSIHEKYKSALGIFGQCSVQCALVLLSKFDAVHEKCKSALVSFSTRVGRLLSSLGSLCRKSALSTSTSSRCGSFYTCRANGDCD